MPRLQQAGQHGVRKDDRLELALGRRAVLARQHVYLALVLAQLADVRLRAQRRWRRVWQPRRAWRLLAPQSARLARAAARLRADVLTLSCDRYEQVRWRGAAHTVLG